MDASLNSSTNFSTLLQLCFNSKESKLIFTLWFVLYMLLVPVFLSVLYVGYRRRRKQHSNVSHSDAFTFHMMAMELLATLGAVVYFCGLFDGVDLVFQTGTTLLTFAFSGQVFFHCLTCVERYLAVVHPITYLRSKKRGGVRIRNLCIAVVWLFSIIMSLIYILPDALTINIESFLVVLVALVLVSFCTVAVLCALIRPGPGDGGGDRKRINQLKRSVFYTMLVILGAILTRLGYILILLLVNFSSGLNLDMCLMTMGTFWVSLPSSLVLPLLFLRRAGKLPCCKQKTKPSTT